MKKSLKVNGVLNIIQRTVNIVIPLITYPYISRVLGRENYGKFSFAYSIITYFLLTTMLGINLYAVREGARIRDNKKEIQKFVNEVFTINCISLAVSYGAFLIISLFVPKINNYIILLLILSIDMPLEVLGRDWINTIYEDYYYLTLRYIIVQLIGVALIFLFVRNTGDYIKYTWIYLFTLGGGYFLNILYTRKYADIRLTAHPNIKKHIIPILILFGGQIAATVYIQSDITMLGFLRTESEVGVYTIASRVYTIAKGMINALTTVTIPRIVYYLGQNDKKNYDRVLNLLRKYLFMFIVPSAVGMFMMSKSILLFIGGNDYLIGNDALKILGIALLVAVFSGYYCNAILIPNKEENKYLIVTVISAAVNIGLNFLFIPMLGMTGAAITTIISEILVLFISKHYCKSYIEKTAINKRDFISVIVGSAFIGVICTLVNMMLDASIIGLCIAIVLSVIIYALTLIFCNHSLAKPIVAKVRNRIRR